jgi:hypothetical protein
VLQIQRLLAFCVLGIARDVPVPTMTFDEVEWVVMVFLADDPGVSVPM